MVKKKRVKDTVHTKKLQKDTNGSLKNYAVKIEYHYLIKANNQTEAIQRSMSRLLGRSFTGVYFNGMVTHAELSEEMPKTFSDDKFKEFKEFDVTESEDSHYGIRVSRDRQDTKEQDHIDFSTADQI